MNEIFLGDLPLWSDPTARKVLEELCATHRVPIGVLEDLIGVQRERAGEERAHNVYPRIEEILSAVE